MHDDELSALIGKTAALMELFERRCEHLDQHQRELAESLQHLAQQIPAQVRQSAEQTLQTLPGQVIGKVQGGLEQPVARYQQQLQEAGTQLGDAARQMAAHLQRMERLHRHVMWKIAGATLGCVALLLGGAVWLSSHYYGVIRDNQIAADLLQAYNRADVTLCGEGRLCANVDAKAKPVGDRGQYLPVKPR